MYLEGWAFLCTCLCIKVKKTGYCEESPDGFSSNFELGGGGELTFQQLG